MHPVPTIPWTPPSVRTFFPPSRVHSIPHHRPHLATPLARAHHRSCLITAHSGPPAWTFDVIMTSVYSTIVTNDFIPSSLLHHHDIFMTSWPGLSFWTLSDMFRTHLWCPFTFISLTRFTFISIIDHYPLFHLDHSFIHPDHYLSHFWYLLPF